MERLSDYLDGCQITSTATLGIDPQWVEAMAFAWLARQTHLGLSGNRPAVTGAREAVILGGIYPAAPSM
jgi:anhydro-N-acetylmuramic acid kinase